MWLTQLEEEDADNGEDPESDDPDGIEGVTEEFMVQLARCSEGCPNRGEMLP